MKTIRKVAILSAESMGGIAGQLASAGIPSFLLGMVPPELSDKEKAQGLTLASPAVRNRVAAANKAMLLNDSPAALMSKEEADLIKVGNLEDNLAWLSECDWVLEVLPENIAIKKAVLKQIAPFIKPETLVTSSTASFSINRIVEDMPLEFRQYWMGTHFFNPVQYMKLMELIPGQDTLPAMSSLMADFGEKVLGKEIVWAKDTPAFIADRLGNLAGLSAFKLMLELGLTVAEVDAITGSVIGRLGTGTFGLYDLVGLDIGMAAAEAVKHKLTDPWEKEMYTMPDFCREMMQKGILGNKSQGGFYKKVGREKLVIDVNTLAYDPIQPVQFASLEAARQARTLPEKLAAFFNGADRAAQFTWKNLTGLFLYAASKIPEIADDIISIDRALCWGYNHAQGPFELWSGLDLEKYIARLEAEGAVIPAWIKEMLAVGIKSFYKSEAGVDYYYDIPEQKYLPMEFNKQ